MVFFLSVRSCNDQLSLHLTDFVLYPYVGIHQVRIHVFDIIIKDVQCLSNWWTFIIGIHHCTCTCTQSVSNREPCRTIQIVSRKYREEIEHIIVDHNRNFKIARFLRWFEIRKVSTAWRIYNNRVLFTDSNLYNL